MASPVAVGAIDGSGWLRKVGWAPTESGKSGLRVGERTLCLLWKGVALVSLVLLKKVRQGLRTSGKKQDANNPILMGGEFFQIQHHWSLAVCVKRSSGSNVKVLGRENGWTSQMLGVELRPVGDDVGSQGPERWGC